jgi:choline kinase
MRVVEDEYGNRFLEIESDEDWEMFKKDLLRSVKKKSGGV